MTTLSQKISNLNNLYNNLNNINFTKSKISKELTYKLKSLYMAKLNGLLKDKQVKSDLRKILNEFDNTNQVVSKNITNTILHITQNEAEILNVTQFDTKKLTKFMASSLTKQTGQVWLPIRYLLNQQTENSLQQEVYAAILADSLLTVPNLTDSLTLLDTPNFNALNRFNIKYTEKDNPNYTNYDKNNLDNIENILMFGNYNLINIGDTNNFNSLFNLNKSDIEFLHLNLSPKAQKTLKYIDVSYPLYKENATQQDKNNPYNIAQNILSKIIDKKLNQQNEIIENNQNFNQ